MRAELVTRPISTTLRSAAAALALTAVAVAASSDAMADTVLEATYVISIGGIAVGNVQAESRFSRDSYSAVIRGSTRGLTRLVTDASAELSGGGEIRGARVLPQSYSSETTEKGFRTHVRMAMRAGTITDLLAVPSLAKAADRVPVTVRHKSGIVDPLSAFLIPTDLTGTPVGRRVCDRTINVFDGWTRFDIQLFYKGTKAVDGGSDSYAGRIIVCGARYLPVAGHRSGRDEVNDMAENERLEVWLARVEGMPLLVPYRLMVGTSMGDLVIHSTRFTTRADQQRADAR